MRALTIEVILKRLLTLTMNTYHGQVLQAATVQNLMFGQRIINKECFKQILTSLSNLIKQL